MITRWERGAVEGLQHLHWGPANWIFVHLSDWWIRSLLVVLVGLAADRAARRHPPLAALLAAVAFTIATVAANALKGVFERPRPSVGHPEIHPLVAVPANGAMPSGHAAGAFAAALAVGLVHPGLQAPLLVLAGLVALSRVWLGVHYPTDVVVGGALGCGVAYAAWRVAAIIAARTSSP